MSKVLARPEDGFERRAAACLHAVLVADTALGRIGSKDRLLVEPPDADPEMYRQAWHPEPGVTA